MLILPLFLYACNPQSTDTSFQKETAIVDMDGDGFAADEDCDDTNPLIHPNALDICNGFDDDCDTEIDEDPDIYWYLDSDGDGFGADESTGPSCSSPSGYVSNSLDCDDTANNVFPMATEICDGVDNNCDGVIDDSITAIVDASASANGDGSPESPYSTITDALSNNETCISVRPGTYYENIEINQAIRLTSTDGPESTIIDAQSVSRCMTITSNDVYVEGFTLTNGQSNSGGGILISADASIKHMIIANNSTQSLGGGAYVYEGNAIFDHVKITDNHATQNGGGIVAVKSSLTLNDSAINNNTSSSMGGLALNESYAEITDTQFDNNYANYMGIMYVDSNSVANALRIKVTNNDTLYQPITVEGKLEVTNGIFYNNNAYKGLIETVSESSLSLIQVTFVNSQGISISGSEATILNSIFAYNNYGLSVDYYTNFNGSYLDIYETGNNWSVSNLLTQDPMFVDLSSSDLRLDDSSPCIDAGQGVDLDNSPADLGAFGGQSSW